MREITESQISEEGFDRAIDGSAAVAKKLLYQGITTVRDAGDVVQGLKRAFDEGLLEGPWIFLSNSCIP